MRKYYTEMLRENQSAFIENMSTFGIDGIKPTSYAEGVLTDIFIGAAVALKQFHDRN